MKKAISLILALVLCLGLCACGENTPTNANTTTNGSNSSSSVPTDTEGPTEATVTTTVPETTESEEEKMQKLIDYNKALDLLENIDIYCTLEQIDDMSKAYNLLVALGNYKDAPDILARFTECSLIITNHPTGQVWKQIYNMQGDSVVSFTDAPKYFINKYDDHGRLVYAECFDSAGKLIYYRTQEYNEAGQIVRQELVRDGNSTAYEFDIKENETIRYYVVNGERQNAMTITYESGVVVREYSGDDTNYVDTTYTYNEDGLLIEKISFFSRTGGANRYTYEYDEDGNLIVEKKYSIYENGETTCSETTYTYSTVYIYTPSQS